MENAAVEEQEAELTLFLNALDGKEIPSMESVQSSVIDAYDAGIATSEVLSGTAGAPSTRSD